MGIIMAGESPWRMGKCMMSKASGWGLTILTCSTTSSLERECSISLMFLVAAEMSMNEVQYPVLTVPDGLKSVEVRMSTLASERTLVVVAMAPQMSLRLMQSS
jgi:hypothetical protein